MISLTRVRTPEAIHPNFTGDKRVQLNKTLLEKKRDGQLLKESADKWNSGIWKMAKDQLLTETFDKCAYCETPTAVVSYGDVEHFRPKSKYWWLAYCYDNYLVSCSICNQQYKKDFFPLHVGNDALAEPVVDPNISDKELAEMAVTLTVDPLYPEDSAAGKLLCVFEKEMLGEYSLIVNPYFEDPSEYFAYKPILETKEIVIVPTVPEYQIVIDACHQYFGINRNELMELRFKHYLNYMTFKYTLLETSISNNLRKAVENRIKELQAGSSQYAGMIRFLETLSLASLPWDPSLTFF